MDLIDGKHTQLLALFSNPSGPTKLKLDVSLQPLKFGQEMKFLLRAIPPVYLELLPAAGPPGGVSWRHRCPHEIFETRKAARASKMHCS